MELFVTLVVVLHQRVQEIVIEVSGAGALQTGGELPARRALGRGDGGVELGRQREAVPRVAFDQSLADRGLRSGIDKGRIKIGKTRFKEQIDHRLDLLDIDHDPPFG